MTALRRASKFFLPFGIFILIFLLHTPGNSYASDIGNCLLCHKYAGMSRVDEEGKMRLFFVNESIFVNSVHSKVKCEGCHTDITEIPHKPAKKVDCLVECHIVEPSTEKKFSHKDVDTFLAKSVHGTTDASGKPKKYVEDMPMCKDCHDEPLYRPLSFFKKVRPGISDAALGRCRVCHKKEDFIYRFYNHVTTRLHKSRNPLNIAEVCARCHDDETIVARHGLSTKAVFSYSETFHGKAARFLDERIPDCLDCHVNKGESVHQMLSHKNVQASTHEYNRGKICSNIDCHPGASPKLATYGVHSEFSLEQSPAQYFFTAFFIILTGGTLLPLMVIILLDLIRRFFPNATIKGRK
ncbi:MAG: cytochrome C [Nitrospirae bacterium]|nr:cytochrome C [Nitrospirota bacterium]